MMSAIFNGKRKVAPSKVLPTPKRLFVPDSFPTAPEPEPEFVPLPEQNANPATEIPVAVASAAAEAPRTYPPKDIVTLYPSRVELYVPFDERSVAKEAKCIWWPEERIWIAPQHQGFEDIISRYEGEYLCLNREDNDEAKRLGATFRPASKTWYGSPSGAGDKFGCVYLTKATFNDGLKLKAEGCRWSPFFRCWYTSRANFIANPAIGAFQ